MIFLFFFIFRSKNSKEKSMSNYILNELISMWFHENLRLFQEELCLLAEYPMQRAFFPLCQRICREFESICSLNWVKTSRLTFSSIDSRHRLSIRKDHSVELTAETLRDTFLCEN